MTDTYLLDSTTNMVTLQSPLPPPDAPLAGVNGTTAENNHGYPPNHNQSTHADGVPTAPVPNGYGDDTKGQG